MGKEGGRETEIPEKRETGNGETNQNRQKRRKGKEVRSLHEKEAEGQGS